MENFGRVTAGTGHVLGERYPPTIRMLGAHDVFQTIPQQATQILGAPPIRSERHGDQSS